MHSTEGVHLMASEPARGTPTSADDVTGPGERGQGPVALPTHRIKRTRTGGIWVAAALFARGDLATLFVPELACSPRIANSRD